MKKKLIRVLKGAARTLALPVARHAMYHRHLRWLGGALLGPALKHRLKALVARHEPLPPRRMHVPLDSADLSPSTQAFYQELKRHFKARKH